MAWLWGALQPSIVAREGVDGSHRTKLGLVRSRRRRPPRR